MTTPPKQPNATPDPQKATPRTDAARAKYDAWQRYCTKYGHLPEAMEQAPNEADPFWIAGELEKQLNILTAQHNRLEMGLPSEYGYSAGDFKRLSEQLAAEVEARRVAEKERDLVTQYSPNMATSLVKMNYLLEQAEAKAREDARRLDFLESEDKREGASKNYNSLFRRNLPITRAAIDAAITERGKV